MAAVIRRACHHRVATPTKESADTVTGTPHPGVPLGGVLGMGFSEEGRGRRGRRGVEGNEGQRRG